MPAAGTAVLPVPAAGTAVLTMPAAGTDCGPYCAGPGTPHMHLSKGMGITKGAGPALCQGMEAAASGMLAARGHSPLGSSAATMGACSRQ